MPRSRKLFWSLPLFSLLCLTFFAFPAFSQQKTDTSTSPPLYLDPKAPVDRRVDDLVSRMTLDEKASQLVHKAAAIPRLQVPAYNWWTEALHGVLTSPTTVFPEPIGLAASFDVPLVHQMAIVISTEARAKHHEQVRHGIFQDVGLDFWSPNVNIFRDPRWGRGQETYGEDPFLTARMGVAFVSGMQGDDPNYFRTISTPKHYAVHSGPETTRHIADVKVSKHDMEDTYLPAFRAAVTEAKAGSVMCVYNSVNGEPGCANSFLLQDQLRDKWKFQGYVVSDCDAVADIQRGHHFVNTLAEAGAISIKRGTDLDCNDTGIDYSRYVAAVQQGLLTEAQLDVAVKRLMKARMQLGMFDPPELVKYAQIPYSEMDTPEHRELSLRLARESMVLLKNDGLLPLKPGTKKIAVVGPLADQLPVLYGNYNGSPSRATSALQGIEKQFGSSEITYSAGTRFLRLGQIISDAILSTPDGQPGLHAEYFKGINFEGAPVLTRVDKTVDFTFSAPDSVPTAGNTNFSTRWTGFLTPQQSGVYEIGFNGDDGYRVWLDDKVLVEDWAMHGPSLKSAPVTLEQGHKYAVRIDYFQGMGGAVAQFVWFPPSADPLKQALADANNADVVIAVVGITSSLEGEEMGINLPGFKGGDRTSIDLPEEEEDLLKAIKTTGKPLVVVLMNGSALAVNWAQANANAILDAWYPGEEGGTAIAETLAGANNPAGRLPVTFYTGIDQLPPFEDYAMNNRTYRYFKGQPLYPFGYGLSYSKFAYSKAKLSKARLKAGEPLTVESVVKNTGDREGDEVVQVYLTFPQLPGAPIRALRGFTRVHVAAGKTERVELKLDPRDLSYVNEAGDRLVAAGKYRISVGGGQPGTSAAAVEVPLEISGEYKLPE